MFVGNTRCGRRVRLVARAALLFIAATLATDGSLAAQPAFTASLGRAFNALSALPTDVSTRQTTAASIEAEHEFANQRFRLFYEMDAGTFTTEGDWHYSLHTAGATYRIPFGSDAKNTVFLTASGSLRSNGLDWETAGFRALGIRANVQLQPRETAAIRFGYRMDARTFPDLAALDQIEHDAFVSVLVNLPTRTTLVGEIHAGAKSYQAYSVTSTYQLAGDATPQHTGRYGRGMGPGLRSGAQAPNGQGSQVSVVPGTRAEQVTWLARVAQSLTDRTGVMAQFTQRSRFGSVPPVLITTPASFFDDGVYDDPFASAARTVTAGAKRQFARGVVLEASASVARKNYAGAAPLDVTGLPIDGVLRADRIARGAAGATLPLFPARTGKVGLDLNIDYFLVRHRSNDAFYNYTSHGVGVGMTASY